ncbi:hypothetical protein E3N88_15942 [Mikania micrantha]|uniref:PB1 domain-containing protein n=1 Tax=Mikania micrantha TaxID=192012 RepID=A0A5N6NXF4_9ASTR|nr:hypothetical protein E3N88_15942 [Mikania micrantha]
MSFLELLQLNSGSPDRSECEGSQNDSSLESDLYLDGIEKILSDLLERSSTHLHFNKKYGSSFVFWREKEGYEDDSSSADDDTPLNTIHEMIKSAFLDVKYHGDICIGQFWAPVTINDRRLLSTSGQPFVIPILTKESVMHRLHFEKHEYDIDVNKLEIEADPKIRSRGPASAFLSRLSCMGSLLESETCFGLTYGIMLPVCFPSDQSECIGVIGIYLKHWYHFMGYLVLHVRKALQVCAWIRFYCAINGLRHAEDKITNALEIICKSHHLGLGQVWGAFEDKSHVPFSSYLKDTRRILRPKFTSYLHNVFHSGDFDIFEWYNSLCDVFPLERTNGSEKHVLKTFHDFKPRYISTFSDDLLLKLEDTDGSYCAFAICLRSAEIGDELEVVEVGIYEEDQDTSFKIFQGKQPILVDKISPSKVTCQTTSKVLHPEGMDHQMLNVICVTTQKSKMNRKTAKIFLTREVIEKQFGKTMNEAAHNIKVSLSTLKRNCKVLGILEWPGPNLLKRKANDSCTIQIDTNEENVTTQDPLTVNINKNIMFIKAENEDDMIKFNLPVLQATFATIKKTIGEKFKLLVGTFKLKYLDEDGDWILLTSNEEMNDCIHNLRKSDRILIRLRVLPTREPVSYPSG